MTKKNILLMRPRLLYCGASILALDAFKNESCDHPRLILIRRGSGVFKFNDNTYPFKAGDLIVVDTNTSHELILDDSQPQEFFFAGVSNLRISGHKPECLLKDMPFVITPTNNYFNRLASLLEALIEENEAKPPLFDIITDSLVKALLIMVVRLASGDSLIAYEKNRKYQRAKEYFDKNYLQIENVDSVCKSLFINKFYLSRLFKHELDMSAIKYLIIKKMQHGTKLLETCDDNITDIAAACGYSDPAYFCRVFKQVYHVTPLQYRFNYKQNKTSK